MEETLLELQYLAIAELCQENSIDFPTREEVTARIAEITAKGEHLSLMPKLDGNFDLT